MTPVNALFPVSSTGNGLTYEGWSSKSDAFTSLATAGGTSAGIGSSIELLRSTAAQCPETSAVVISSTPAWCDCCVLTFIRSIYLDPILYGRETRALRAHAGVAAPSFIPCFSREIFTVNRYSYSISTVVSFLIPLPPPLPFCLFFFTEFVFDTSRTLDLFCILTRAIARRARWGIRARASAGAPASP